MRQSFSDKGKGAALPDSLQHTLLNITELLAPLQPFAVYLHKCCRSFSQINCTLLFLPTGFTLICNSICTSFISLVYFSVTVKKELSLISRPLRSGQHKIRVSKKLSATPGVSQDETKMPFNNRLGFMFVFPKGRVLLPVPASTLPSIPSCIHQVAKLYFNNHKLEAC